jgi:hypothetical protein
MSVDSPSHGPLSLPTKTRFGPVQAGELRHDFQAWLPPDVSALKLAGFCRAWDAAIDHVEPGQIVLRVALPCAAWRRWIGWQPHLVVRLTLTEPQTFGKSLTPVAVVVGVMGVGRRHQARWLREVGPSLIDGLRAHLKAGP